MRDLFRERGAAAAGFLLLLLVLASCGTKEDNSLGVGFIQDLGDQKAVRFLALAADSSADFQSAGQPTNAGDAPALAIGSQPGYFARSLMQFEPATFPPAGTVLDSARVLLSYDDAAGVPDSLQVGVHRVTESWGEAAVPTPFPAFLAAADSVMLRKLEAAETTFVSATSIAQFWVDNPDSNLGLALVPSDTTGVMLEFASRNSSRRPALLLHWNDGTADTSVTVAIALDTSEISKTASFVPLSGQPGRLTIGRGIPTSSLIRFPIPELGERATVNRAVLTVHVDRTVSSFNSFSTRIQRVTEVPWAADSTVVEAVVYSLETVSADSDSLQFELGSLVTVLNRAEGSNFGFFLRAQENRSDTDYLRLHGPDTATPAKAPSLAIWYTPDEGGTP